MHEILLLYVCMVTFNTTSCINDERPQFYGGIRMLQIKYNTLTFSYWPDVIFKSNETN